MSAPLTPASSPALARIKRACRAAIARCGGVDGAGATAQRARSVAGDWNNLNSHVFPPLDCALALDEVAVAQGFRPEVLHALAGEMGFALIALPHGDAQDSEIGLLVMAVTRELGEVSARVCAALADHRVQPGEAAGIESEVDDVIDRAVQLRSHLRALQGVSVVGGTTGRVQ